MNASPVVCCPSTLGTTKKKTKKKKKNPRRFLKPAVCKYPTTVNKSEIYILLEKPYGLIWHLVRGNCRGNGRGRRPETRRMRSPKVALLMLMSTAFSMFRCWRNRLLRRSPLCWFNEYVHVRVVILQRNAYRNFQMCKF